MGFGVWSLGLGVEGLRFRVWGAGFRVQDSGFGILPALEECPLPTLRLGVGFQKEVRDRFRTFGVGV